MWFEGFEVVTFPQSLGFPYRTPIRAVCWHKTEGFQAEHAFTVYENAPKGACPHITCQWDEAPNYRRRYQHVDSAQASYAVQRGNPQFPCRVETNAAGIIQIEDVGFSADAWDYGLNRLKWLGEQVLAPILAAHPEIPWSVYHGDRMTEDEWAAWPGGQCRHRDLPCQPDRHTDPGDLDLDVILHYALELLNPPPLPPEPDMFLLRVVDDPNYPIDAHGGGGVVLELSGNGISWVKSANVVQWYDDAGIKTVSTTADKVVEALWTKPGVGPSPSTAVPPSIVHW